MSILSKEILENVVGDISQAYNTWLNQSAIVLPQDILTRRKYMRGLKCFIKTMIGLFIKPHFNKEKEIYIFEGLRNKYYMAAFSSDSIVIVGSHVEKEYANANGYGFCWSFPIESGIHSKISKGWNYPAIRQLLYWVDKLSIFSKVTFFLYEDTQPLGLFMVHLSRLLHPNVSTVCIQHGYFGKQRGQSRRADGTYSDINFILDQRQAKFLGSNRQKSYVIGLPYVATAKPSNELQVVLVGTGGASDGTVWFERTINTYILIRKILSNISGVKVLYRPHPNEYNDEKLLAELSNRFLLVDEPNKVKQLNGSRAIFIGILSSLLYEAGIAGHHIGYFKLNPNVRPDFDFDFEFEENETNELMEWVLSIKNNNNFEDKSLSVNQLAPLERFNLALREAKLID